MKTNKIVGESLKTINKLLSLQSGQQTYSKEIKVLFSLINLMITPKIIYENKK